MAGTERLVWADELTRSHRRSVAGKPSAVMWDLLREFWPYLALLLDVLVAAVASSHAVLHKRDLRAAIAWVGLIWLTPLVGAGLCVWLGINRIQRRARSLRLDRLRPESLSSRCQCPTELLAQTLGTDGLHLRSLTTLVGGLTKLPLLHGNRVEPLLNGDQAYPSMIQAIDSAARSITLSSYIFDNDRAGRLFLDALQRAVARGVAVRVLIDDVGARYSWPAMPRLLRRAGIVCGRFLPTSIPWRFRFTNLRTHRKLLVIDGRLGFTGGMNIREGHCLAWQPRHPVQDLYFRAWFKLGSQRT